MPKKRKIHVQHQIVSVGFGGNGVIRMVRPKDTPSCLYFECSTRALTILIHCLCKTSGSDDVQLDTKRHLEVVPEDKVVARWCSGLDAGLLQGNN